MLFDNYLNISKLVFIWINLDLKLILKKINFKLVLFYPKIFSFYFISSYYLSTILHYCPHATIHHHPPPTTVGPVRHHFLPLTALVNHHQSLSATIRLSLPAAAIHHHWLPSPPIATVYCCRLPPPPPSIAVGRYRPSITADHHHPTVATIVYCWRPPPPATVCHHPPPLAAIVCHRLLD